MSVRPRRILGLWSAFLLFYSASHLPFLSAGLPTRWGTQTHLTLLQCTQHVYTVPYGLGARRPQDHGAQALPPMFVRPLDCRLLISPPGPSPAHSPIFSYSQALSPGKESQFKQNFLRKMLLQQQTQPEEPSLKPQPFNQSSQKIIGRSLLEAQKVAFKTKRSPEQGQR